MRVLIVDGYLDEPASLGVPPYISPDIRYAYGVLKLHGIDVSYKTIDQIRNEDVWRFDSDVLILFGGTTVPGRYLSGSPMTLSEALKILKENERSIRIVAGPMTMTYSLRGGTKAISPNFEAEYVVKGDLWAFLKTFLKGDPKIGARGSYEDLEEVAKAGASILKEHPFYPNLICEIEVSKGCERETFCSFCTEPVLHGRLRSRPAEDVAGEVKSLYDEGCRAFRLGRSANIISYMADRNGWKPSPQAVEELYSGIRSVAPDLEVLHTDNANPAYIVRNLKEAYKVIEVIAKYDTPGDVLSFGVESFDEEVLNKNNIDSNPEEVLEAVKVVNEIGSFRVDGIPKLLPGINLIYGLPGESERTYKINYDYLKKILDSGLLLRRINIRQVIVHPITPLFRMKRPRIKKGVFRFWKEKIREEIDRPMLERVFPFGAILKGIIPEKREGRITFGRQLGTYPILVGTPSEVKGKFDAVVVDHGRRSITALKIPIDINSITFEELTSIKGVGKKRSEEIIRKRPFRDLEDMKGRLSGETFEILKGLSHVILW